MKPPLDSRRLRAFVSLARTGSFTHSGKELFVSQSAVSYSMKALESDIGCRLFDRLGKKVILTQAGETLLHYAEKILTEMESARASIERLGKWGHTRLRLGASITACEHILPPVLRELKERFPQCLISISPGDTHEVIEALQQNAIDLALSLQPKNDDRFEFRPLFTDEMVFVLGPSHPWAERGRVVREEIPRQNYVLYSKSSYTFQVVEEYFREEAMVLNTVIELGSMEAIKELVKLGLGISIVAPWIARKELAEKTLVALPLGRRKLKRTWGILHWPKRRLSLAEENFISLCRSVTSTLADPTGSSVAA
jgi:DNA-binding transcriptional LysR family regulator